MLTRVAAANNKNNCETRKGVVVVFEPIAAGLVDREMSKIGQGCSATAWNVKVGVFSCHLYLSAVNGC